MQMLLLSTYSVVVANINSYDLMMMVVVRGRISQRGRRESMHVCTC